MWKYYFHFRKLPCVTKKVYYSFTFTFFHSKCRPQMLTITSATIPIIETRAMQTDINKCSNSYIIYISSILIHLIHFLENHNSMSIIPTRCGNKLQRIVSRTLHNLCIATFHVVYTCFIWILDCSSMHLTYIKGCTLFLKTFITYKLAFVKLAQQKNCIGCLLKSHLLHIYLFYNYSHQKRHYLKCIT